MAGGHALRRVSCTVAIRRLHIGLSNTLAIDVEHSLPHLDFVAAPGMAAVTSVMRAQQVFLARIDELLAREGLTLERGLLGLGTAAAVAGNRALAHGAMHEGDVSRALGIPGIPASGPSSGPSRVSDTIRRG